MKNEIQEYYDWLKHLIVVDDLDEPCRILILNTLYLITIYVEKKSCILNPLLIDIKTANTASEDCLVSFHRNIYEYFYKSDNSTMIEHNNIKNNIRQRMLSNEYLSLVIVHNYLYSEKIVKQIVQLSKNVIHCERHEASDFWYGVTALMILEYKNHYNLLLGNALLRTLILHNKKFGNAVESAYAFLKNQFNPKGYFGYYLKDKLDQRDLFSILCIGFDCVLTILEFENKRF